MSFLLSVLGAVAVVIGVVMVAFGIPVREFSFGNTLILGGVTSLVGGMMLFGLGVVAAQLQRVSEALALRPAPRANNRQPEALEAPAQAQLPRPAQQPETPARFPFPPKSRNEQGRDQFAGQRTPEPNYYDERSPQFPPLMRNPDEASQHDEFDDAPLSPPQMPFQTRNPSEFFDARGNAPAHGMNGGSNRGDKQHEAAFDWPGQQQTPQGRRQPQQTQNQPQQPAYFDAMWPAPEARAPKSPDMPKAPRGEPPMRGESAMRPEPAPRSEPVSRNEAPMRAEAPREPAMPQPRRAERAAEPEAPKAKPEPRAAAILKSGVVDGMGYTLYVDGSIEATLPQGTLRFASINELRHHLEKNS